MFGHKHYIPILRSKQGEWDALLDLHKQSTDTSCLTPLIEIVPDIFWEIDKNNGSRIQKSPEKVLINLANNALHHWGYRNPIFVDGRYIDEAIYRGNDVQPLVFFNNHSKPRGLKLIPVTGLNDRRTRPYQAAIAQIIESNQNGVCIRLMLEDTTRGDLANKLDEVLNFLDVTPKDVDLLVDFQDLNQTTPVRFKDLGKILPRVNEWRTFTVAAGVFPKFASFFDKYEQHEWPRSDWLNWKDQILSPSGVPRLPSFGDYTVQHPFYEELPPGITPSAAIRYACEDYWIVTRGEPLKNPDDFKQYPAFARLLCDREEFSGKDFSKGDAYILDKSLELEKGLDIKMVTGNARTWISSAINRHISLVVHQLSNLPEV